MTTQPSDWAVELLPCPFCGASGNRIGLHSMLLFRCWRVQCVCGAEGGPFCPIPDHLPWGTQEQAIAAWNTRHDHSPDAGKMGEAEEGSLRFIAKRNLRRMIEIGSTDKATMLLCLEELS